MIHRGSLQRRTFLLGLAAAASLQPRPARADVASLNVGFIPFDPDAVVVYARDRGYFKSVGIDPTLVPVLGGGVVVSGLLAGSFDLGTMSIGTLANARLRGIPLYLVAPSAVATDASKDDGIFVRSSSAIRTAADLNGKTMGIFALKNMQHAVLMQWIDQHGGDALVAAFNRASGPAQYSRVVGIGYGYDSCDAFADRAVNDAKRQTDDVARVLGAAIPGLSSDTDVTQVPHFMDGPIPGVPLCGLAAHLDGIRQVDVPTVGSFTERRTFRSARSIRFAERADVPASEPPSFVTLPASSQIALRSSGVLLTLWGDAFAEPVANGTTYVLRGPVGNKFRSPSTVDTLDTMRSRLIGVGVPSGSIITQLSQYGGFVVVVHVDATQRDESIVDAIAGNDPAQRVGVQVTTTYGGCPSDAVLIPRAVADATDRLRRLASSLGTIADPHPVAITAGQRMTTKCEVQSFSSEIDRRVFVTFRIRKPSVIAALSRDTAPDDHDDVGVQQMLSASATTYAGVQQIAGAQRSLERPADRLRVTIDISPDNANDFRAIDRSIVTKVARDLGVEAGNVHVSYLPSFGQAIPGDVNGTPMSPGLRLVAQIPSLSGVIDTALAAVRNDVASAGYGDVSALPERDDCIGDSDLLARDVVRAALATKPNGPTGPLLAIDVRGPFVVTGSCRSSSEDQDISRGRPSPLQDVRQGRPSSVVVRLVAYARASYAGARR